MTKLNYYNSNKKRKIQHISPYHIRIEITFCNKMKNTQIETFSFQIKILTPRWEGKQPITSNNTCHNHKSKEERKREKQQHGIVPRTDRNFSMSRRGGTKPVPPEAKTTLQVSNSIWTGGFFLSRRRFRRELLLAMVSLEIPQNSLPFLSVKAFSIPIQNHHHQKRSQLSPTNSIMQCQNTPKASNSPNGHPKSLSNM